ncbi:hypothetical protein Nit79A3_2426 [Nitrosomonas sp. Is79A3]|uniref:hypothetical protein n=1 Tax=Nitrosomonas sp. (strain Is79A3) TaxID=261292 RepID=UPI000215CAD9
MQNEHEQRSNEGSDLPEKNSVYDFLYHDIQRIGSFLSQFDPNGHLQSSINSSYLSQSRSASSEKSITAKLPAIAEGKTTTGHGNAEVNNNGSSRTYDPLWQNSIALLDYLEQRNLIGRDIMQSHIGQFVLVSGKLFMFDMGFMQKLTQGTMLKKAFVSGYTGAEVNKNNKNSKAEVETVLEVLASLPGSIQARIIGDGFSVWSTLRAEGLSLSTDDLHLKHGPNIAGSWNVLGILDALPDNDTIADFSFLPPFQLSLANFSNLIRPTFGRSSDYFGITPLLVFREVTGN